MFVIYKKGKVRKPPKFKSTSINGSAFEAKLPNLMTANIFGYMVHGKNSSHIISLGLAQAHPNDINSCIWF